MLANILRAPMMFFDTTPIGRILNRFSQDLATVDVVLPFTVRAWLPTFFNLLATIVIISYSTPIFIAVVVPLLIIYYLIQVDLLPGTLQVGQSESVVIQLSDYTNSELQIFSVTSAVFSDTAALQRQDFSRSRCIALSVCGSVYFSML